MPLQPPDSLLGWLAETLPVKPASFEGWQIYPVGGGTNNRPYRAVFNDTAWCVKCCRVDARDRAGREFQILQRVAEAGCGPVPVRLERERWACPLVVQEWLSGTPPCLEEFTPEDWEALIALRCRVFAHSANGLPAVVITASSPAEMRTRIYEQLQLLGETDFPGPLAQALEMIEQTFDRHGQVAPIRLCHGDSNIENFVKTDSGWRLVDWEYSGAGDPAFEIAEWCVQPEWRMVSESQWEYVIQETARRLSDPTLPERVGTYRFGMCVWWLLRLLRFLKEVPQGADRRLVERPADWEENIRIRQRHFLRLLETAIGNR